MPSIPASGTANQFFAVVAPCALPRSSESKLRPYNPFDPTGIPPTYAQFHGIVRLVFGVMAVAVIFVHLPIGFFWMIGGFEYPLLWGVVALYFMVRGGGRYSVDAAIGREI